MSNTTSSRKPTKRDMFTAILNKYPLTEDEQKFIDHEIELLDKKNSADKKPTAQQVANQGIQSAILAHMERDKMYTITDLIKTVPECAELTNQKVSALVRLMLTEHGGPIEKVEDKRKSYFILRSV